jgi:anionic cell wall polymer biosynthesis LytR-Cps2A-Psr (LCP) family protein
VEGVLGALRTRKADDHDERIIARQRQLGRTVVDNELQRETIRRLEDGLPLALRRSKR